MIKISVNPFFFLLFFLAIFYNFIYEVLLLFSIVIIHELGHACTALSFGWRLKKIEILPFGGVAEVDEHGNKPIGEEALVILAGPAMNFLMIGFAYICFQAGLWQEGFTFHFIEYNLIILVFNLLPILPLDGGKLAQLMLSLVLPFRKAIKYSLLVSGGCFFIYIIFISSHYWLYVYMWLVASFLLVSQLLEWKQAPYQYIRFLLERHQQGVLHSSRLRIKTILIHPQWLIKDALAYLFRHRTHYFCVVNRKGDIENIIHERDMLDQNFTHKNGYCTVRDIFG